MLNFNHGKPIPNDFSLIAQPHTGGSISDKVGLGSEEDPYKQALLKDQKSGEETTVEIHNMWRFTIDEDGLLIDAWAKLAYGITGPKLINYMRLKYPNVQLDKIEFILIKIL